MLAAAGAAAAMTTSGTTNVSACEAAAAEPRTHKKGIMDPLTYPTPEYFDYDAGDDEDSEETTTVTTTKTVDGSAVASNNSKDGLKDPMTIFAKIALQQEMKEKGQAQAVEEGQLATSPAEERKNASLEAQKEAIQKGELTASLSPDELRIEEAARKAKQHSGGLKLFSGNGNLALSLEICRYLGINLGKATVGRFADGEANVVVHENVRGKDCYVIQPTCPPVNDNIMELLLMVSTLRRASARRITVVIPYYGYARQDRKMQVSPGSAIVSTTRLRVLTCKGL